MKRLMKGLLTVCTTIGVALVSTRARAENILLREDVIVDASGNSFAADGTVTIGANGLNLRYADWATPFIAAASGVAVTLIAEVEDIPLPTETGVLNTLLTVYVANAVGTTLDVNSDGILSADWNHGNAGFCKKSAKAITSGKHRIALVYKNGWGAQAYVDGEAWTECTGASASAAAITRAYVGQYGATGTGWNPCAATGMKVSRVAVVDRQMTAEEIAAYDWELPAHYARFGENFANRVVTCTAGNSADIAGNAFRASRFDSQNGTRTTPDYLGGTTATLPGSGVSEVFWHAFCQGVNGYSAPGLVLRFPACSESTHPDGFRLDGGFGPLNVGGLIVEAGAALESKPVTFYEVQGRFRQTFFGDTTGRVETHFVINDDFCLNRQGECKFYGTLNLDIAAGKLFDCTTDRSDVQTTVANSARVKMHGAGTFKVRTLTASGATLDYSDLPLDRATAYIDGNLAIDGTTCFVFPSGLAAGVSYALCSGTILSQASSYVTTIALGNVEKKVVLTVSGGAVSYSEPVAFVDGVAYYSAQAAFDAAGADSTVEIWKDATVTVSVAKTLKELNLFADLEVSGGAALTFAADGKIDVGAAKTLTVSAPVVLTGIVTKTGAGEAIFGGSFGSNSDKDSCQLVVSDGRVDFNGAISGVTICGRGLVSDEAKWPVITLQQGCTVDLTTALVAPALASGRACYGKVIQNGAIASTATVDPCLMDPLGGSCKYVLNSGTFDVGNKSINLLNKSTAYGRVLFEQNGGTLKAQGIMVCRIAISPARDEQYLYVLNGGTLQSYVSSAPLNDERDPDHFANKVRVELNGGTYDVRSNTSLFANKTLTMAISGDVTLKNGTGVTTTVPADDYLAGDIGLLTFVGAGTFDFSAATGLSAGDVAVTGGTALLNGGLLDADSTLSIANGAKAGLAYEGVKDIKSLNVGGREGVKDRICGLNHASARYFAVTDPAGAVKPSEGRDAKGLVLSFQ